MKALQGAWDVVALEVDGTATPEIGFRGSGIVIKGTTFTTVAMGAEYGGTYSVDESNAPKTIDLSFKSGPEKGNTSLAIFELDGDTWRLCLTITAKTRPKTFATKPGSGLALETLKRRTAPGRRERMKEELALLQGEWSMVECVMDGQDMPAQFAKTGRRIVTGNETSVLFGDQVYLKAAFALNPSSEPKTIDYIVTAGDNQGETQAGIYKIDRDVATYFMAPAGQPRPADFTARSAGGGTLTVWKRKKK